jgi:hypothetical protein
MANTTKLSKEERKKAKRTARKKRKAEKPLKPRDYPRGSKKPKVKKLARGQAKPCRAMLGPTVEGGCPHMFQAAFGG